MSDKYGKERRYNLEQGCGNCETFLVFLFLFTRNDVVGINPIWFSCPNLKAIRNH